MTVHRHHGDFFGLFDNDPTYKMLVVTVNVTTVGRNGHPLKPSSFGPMGKGCALQAAKRWRWLHPWWANMVAHHRGLRFAAVAFPGGPDWRKVGCLVTKEKWWEPSTPALVRASLGAMTNWLMAYPDVGKVLMPLPGAGEGGLDPDEVWRLVDDTLDERFTVCTL